MPLLLVFLSVRWWKIFTSQQCESVNVRPLVEYLDAGAVRVREQPHRLVHDTILHVRVYGPHRPFRANYRAIAADVVSKVVIGARWVLFARGRRNTAVNWSVIGFSLSTLTSSLVVGMPMAQGHVR
jgi:auxin efflux carrier family